MDPPKFICLKRIGMVLRNRQVDPPRVWEDFNKPPSGSSQVEPPEKNWEDFNRPTPLTMTTEQHAGGVVALLLLLLVLVVIFLTESLSQAQQSWHFHDRAKR